MEPLRGSRKKSRGYTHDERTPKDIENIEGKLKKIILLNLNSKLTEAGENIVNLALDFLLGCFKEDMCIEDLLNLNEKLLRKMKRALKKSYDVPNATKSQKRGFYQALEEDF